MSSWVDKVAIHLPNGVIRNKQGMRDTGFRHWVLLDGEWVHIPDLRIWTPDGDIVVRFYHPNWSVTDGAEWGRHCSDEYVKDRGGWSMASMGCRVTVANEQNIEPAGTNADRAWYQKINDWNVACYNEIKRLGKIPLNKLDWPALAPGHSDDDNTRGFVGLEVCRPAITLYLSGGGRIHVHCYWFGKDSNPDPERQKLTALDLCVDEWFGHRFVRTHALYPTATLCITEFGGFDTKRETAPQEYVKFLRSLAAFPYVRWAAGFIWETPYGDHWQNDWSANPAIAQAVKTAIAEDGGGTDAMTEAELLRIAANTYDRKGIAWNPASAITKFWVAQMKAGNYLGEPTSAEFRTESGRYVCQQFASAMLFWDSQTGVVSPTVPLAA